MAIGLSKWKFLHNIDIRLTLIRILNRHPWLVNADE
jgi:hypothetical protein